MTITPYNISESTKIAKAYLKNVVGEASAKSGSDTVDRSDGSTDTQQSTIQSTNDKNPNTTQPKPSLWERIKNAKGRIMGDIVNAGIRTMANGSSLAPVPYKPGTGELKSSKELQQEQKNTAIAGAAGLAALNPAAAAKLGYYALNGYGLYELGKTLSGETTPSSGNNSQETTPSSENNSNIGLTAAMIAAPIAGYAIAKYGLSLGKAIKNPKNNVGKNFVIVNNGKYLNSEGFSSSITKDTIVFSSIKSAQNTIDALNSVNKGDYTIKKLDSVIR